METGYKRSMGCNYMILQEQDSDSEAKDSYQTHIFLENQIAGLLPCRLQKIDGKILFYYEITGCQNLVHLFEKNKFSGQDIESLFLAVTRIAETLDEYLLERNRILLHPAYVYQNLETGRFMFVWFPDSKKTMEEEFRSLTEYILPKINHEDKRAVAAGYGVYRLSVESYIDMEAVRQQIFSGKEAQKEESANRKTERYEENEDTQEAWKKEKQRQQILDRFYEEETEEKNSYLLPVGVVLVIVVLAGMYLFRRNVYALVGGAGLLTAAGLGSGIWYIRKKKCRNESIEKENKENVWEEFPKENFYPEHETKAEIAGYCSKSKEDGLTVVLNERTPSGACLQCMDGARDEIYEIEKEITLLGKRKEAVDIWLNIPTVSRVHAKIIHKTEGDYLVDLNSRNGTLMNGKYLNPEEEYFMENECTIIFAQTKFLYLSGN